MKKFLSLVLALVMTMSLVTVSAGAKDFTDNSKIEYKEAVDVVSALGIVEGYEDGAFNPQNTLTRGAAAKIICNLILGTTTASALRADTAPYSDVPTTNTFAGYITYCAQEKIINGYPDGSFQPERVMSREEMASLLFRMIQTDVQGAGPIFSDVLEERWSYQEITALAQAGILNGYEDDTFRPERALTRGEMAALLARLPEQ